MTTEKNIDRTVSIKTLKNEVERIARTTDKLIESRKRLSTRCTNLRHRVALYNDERRRTTVRLILAQGYGICTFHKTFMGEDRSEYKKVLVPADSSWVLPVEAVKVYKNWTESHRYYDSDPTYTDRSSEHIFTVCETCKRALRGGFSVGGVRHSLAMYKAEYVGEFSFEEYYLGKVYAEMIDEISVALFGLEPLEHHKDLWI